MDIPQTIKRETCRCHPNGNSLPLQCRHRIGKRIRIACSGISTNLSHLPVDGSKCIRLRPSGVFADFRSAKIFRNSFCARPVMPGGIIFSGAHEIGVLSTMHSSLLQTELIATSLIERLNLRLQIEDKPEKTAQNSSDTPGGQKLSGKNWASVPADSSSRSILFIMTFQ